MDSRKDLLTADRDDTLVRPIPNHTIAFPGTCLPIGEAAAIVPLPRIVQHIHTQAVVDKVLVRIVTTFLGPVVAGLVSSETIVRPE
jgi:hypothetical protein